MKAKKVLLVCTGNLCRSPMAEGFTRLMIEERGLDGQLEVASAGTSALEGEPATPLAIYVMAQRGIPISSHRSHRVTAEDLSSAELVLAMTQAQREALAAEFPIETSKVYLLSELAGETLDIIDPMGNPDPTAYERCADEIGGYLERGWARLIQILGINKDGLTYPSSSAATDTDPT